jgi:uncharacterized delta-60 repeat protein
MFYILYIFLLCLTTTCLHCAPGDLDLTFGPNGTGISLTRIGRSNSLNQLVLDANSGFYSVGEVEIITLNSGVGRYTINGTLDPSFNKIGYQRFLVGNKTTLYTVAIQQDSLIVVGGYSLTDQSDFIVARFNPDGSLDTTFGGTGYVTTRIGTGASIHDIKIQADGKIVAAGCAIQDVPQCVVARYNPDGSLDQAFGNSGITLTQIDLQSSALAVELQTDGKIVIAGYAYNDSNEHFTLVRYNADGSLDETFGIKGIVHTEIGICSHANAIALQADGKIIAAGYTSDRFLNDFALARYDINGILDPSFNETGIVITESDYDSTIKAIVIQPDGKIVAGGYNFGAIYTTFALARYLPSGDLDASFGTNGIAFTPIGDVAQIDSLILQNDGKIIAGGFSDNNIAIARYLAS